MSSVAKAYTVRSRSILCKGKVTFTAADIHNYDSTTSSDKKLSCLHIGPKQHHGYHNTLNCFLNKARITKICLWNTMSLAWVNKGQGHKAVNFDIIRKCLKMGICIPNTKHWILHRSIAKVKVCGLRYRQKDLLQSFSLKL